MEGLTLSLGQRNWKIVVEYGFKGYQNLDLERLPNLFNIKDTIKGFLTKESIFSKIKKTIFNIKTKIPFFKKWQEKQKEYSNYREFKSIHIPLKKEYQEAKQTEFIS